MIKKAAWLIVPVVFGLALWGAKYRFNHPPLSRTDREFRQMADQSDEVVILDNRLLSTRTTIKPILARLRGAQIRELEANARFSDSTCLNAATDGQYGLRFYHQKKLIGGVNILIGGQSWVAFQPDQYRMPWPFGAQERSWARQIHGRFIPQFTAYLERIAPNHDGG